MSLRPTEKQLREASKRALERERRVTVNQRMILETQRARIIELETALRIMIKSAQPHPVEHPTMWKAWRAAEVALAIPNAERRTNDDH